LKAQFVGRANWIGLKTDFEMATGKKETNGVYILDDKLVEKLETPDFRVVQKSIDAINKFSSKTYLPIYVMVAPTATGIYIEEIPKNAPKFDQKAFIDLIYGKLDSEKIVALDAYSALFPTRDEYIYYRNDHHWTTLGAYYAYASTIKKMGFSPINIDKFNIEHASSDFKGSLYSKALYDGIQADNIDFYDYSKGTKVTSVQVNNGIETKVYNSVYFRDFLEKKDKYSAFLGSNQPLVKIETDLPEERRLLIFKDSYANCYVPFLAQHYSEISLVDLRYVNGGIDNLIDLNEYDQILFLYNASNFSTEENIRNLNFIK